MKKLCGLVLTMLLVFSASIAFAAGISISISYDRSSFVNGSPVKVTYSVAGGSGEYHVSYWMNGYDGSTEDYFGQSQWNARTSALGPSSQTITYTPNGYKEIYFCMEVYDTNGTYASAYGKVLKATSGSSSAVNSNNSNVSGNANGTWYCPKCGTNASNRFCYNCGYDRQSSGSGGGNSGGNSGSNFGSNSGSYSGSYSVGSYVRFGSYPQSYSGSYSSIEWQVLDIDRTNNKMLIISRYALDAGSFNSNSSGTTWESSSMRSWLNGSFLNTAFSSSERSDIVSAYVDNSKSQSWRRSIGGSDTYDKVFLLSYREVIKYMTSDSARRCTPTSYAVSHGAGVNSEYGTCGWWLRNNCDSYTDIATIPPSGDGSGYSTDYKAYPDAAKRKGIRPAMWVSMSSGYISK